MKSTKKNVSQLFGSVKNWFLATSSLTNTVAAIWRDKKVDPSYLDVYTFHQCWVVTQRLEEGWEGTSSELLVWNWGWKAGRDGREGGMGGREGGRKEGGRDGGRVGGGRDGRREGGMEGG